MSHSSSPTNRNSIFGWVKSLKRGAFLSNESVNEIPSDKDETSLSHGLSLTTATPINVASGAGAAGPTDNMSSPSSASKQDFLRPSLLNYRSRSANNVSASRIRSNSLNQSEKSLRQHRDLYLQSNSLVDENSKYFGVPLEDAINQSCAKISILTDDPENSLLYGRIPIVVAKCAIFIKKSGLNVEGIFRVGGSSKRLKELQAIFNNPPDFGKKLSWEGYTVHDASSILRRYLNALPEPLVPLDLYEEFRDPLRERQRIINYMKYKAENPTPKTPPQPSSSQQPSAQQPSQSSQPQALSQTTVPVLIPAQEGSQIEPAASTSLEVKVSETPISLLDSEPLTEANIDRLNQVATSRPTDFSRQRGATDTTAYTSNAGATGTCSEEVEGEGEGDCEAVNALKDEKEAKKSRNYKKLSKDVHDAIEIYKAKLDELPILSKQLLFYILDLLAMVNTQSSQNLMSSRNLAAIFQPSILSHPNHDMDPVEYALSQSVVEFLIRYAYKLLPLDDEKDDNAILVKKDITEDLTLSSSPPTDSLLGGSLPSPTTGGFNRFHSKSLSSSQSNLYPRNELDIEGEVNSIDYDSTDDEYRSHNHHNHNHGHHANLNKSNITLDSGVHENSNHIDAVLEQLNLKNEEEDEADQFDFKDKQHRPDLVADTTLTPEDAGGNDDNEVFKISPVEIVVELVESIPEVAAKGIEATPTIVTTSAALAANQVSTDEPKTK